MKTYHFSQYLKKHIRKAGIIVLFIITCFVFNPYSGKVSANEENQCIKCHTSAKMLIAITREIAKANPKPEPEKSKGEG